MSCKKEKLRSAIINCVSDRNILFDPAQSSPHLRIFWSNGEFKVVFNLQGPGDRYQASDGECFVKFGLDVGYIDYSDANVDDGESDITAAIEACSVEQYIAHNIDAIVDEALEKVGADE